MSGESYKWVKGVKTLVKARNIKPKETNTAQKKEYTPQERAKAASHYEAEQKKRSEQTRAWLASEKNKSPHQKALEAANSDDHSKWKAHYK